jgi:diguanylate cyclase (GGDEF)-like protein
MMARLARLPTSAALLGAVIALAGILLADSATRHLGLRLVPLYVPALCVMFWALGPWSALLVAIAAALIAIVPDVVISADPLGVATVANAAIRLISYLFLALIVIAYRRTYDEADLRAMYDGLTGVLNKMSFEAAIAEQSGMVRRTRQTLLVLYVDFDGFKAVNTIHGHAAGDAALRAFARDAMAAIRGSDLVGRLGGDEFGFLLTATSDPNAEALAHLLHQRLTMTLVKTGLPLSCSMGGLIVPPRAAYGETELLDAADRIMRKAKAGGRNRVLIERIGDFA